MSDHETPSTDRRTFLQSGALVTAAAIGSIPAAGAQEQPAKLIDRVKTPTLIKRPGASKAHGKAR